MKQTLPVAIETTERLRLRRMIRDDRHNLLRLDSDPEVMRYISDGVPSTETQIDAAIERILGYYQKGDALGLWAAELMETGEFIGWFSLKPLPGFDEIEIGYRLLKAYWGRGYATEGARAMVRRGFEVARLDCIAAIHHPENLASRRVLEKAGLRFERRAEFKSPSDGISRPVDFLAIHRDERAGNLGSAGGK